MIFSVNLILPNVGDCYLQDHLHGFYRNLVNKSKVYGFEPYRFFTDLFVWGYLISIAYLHFALTLTFDSKVISVI